MKVFIHTIDTIASKEGYSSLFKAFIALATIYVISALQVANLVMPIESHAYELKYSVEQEIKKEISSFKDLDCNFKMKTYKDCKLAIYKENLSETTLGLLLLFQKFIMLFAVLTGTFSIFGFLIHPYVHEKA